MAEPINEEFMKVPIDFFECCVCCNTAFDSIYSPCSHIICTLCYDQLKDKKCPMCRTNITGFQKNLVNERLLSLYLQTIKCRNEGCDFKGAFKDVSKHNKNCPYRIVSCEKCGLKMASSYYKEKHPEICTFRMVKCEKCLAELEAPDLFSHQEHQCIYRLVTCDNQCGVKMEFRVLEEHKKDCKIEKSKDSEDSKESGGHSEEQHINIDKSSSQRKKFPPIPVNNFFNKMYSNEPDYSHGYIDGIDAIYHTCDDTDLTISKDGSDR